MRKSTRVHELVIDAAEGKDLIVRYPAAPVAEADSDHEAIELVIDVTCMGIVGPYMKASVQACVRLGRADCEALKTSLQRCLDADFLPTTIGDPDGVSVRIYSGVERATWKPRTYTALEFRGLDLVREFKSRETDYRTYVWFFPVMVGQLINTLADVLKAPEQRRFALPHSGHSEAAGAPAAFTLGG